MYRALLLVVPFVLVAVAGSVGNPELDGEQWSANLVGLTSSYGPETWKYDLAYEGQANPATIAGHLQNATTSYYGSLGLRASVRIQIYETQDRTRASDATYNVSAYLSTFRGNVYAYVKRDASNLNLFTLDFDMDGSSNIDPLGRTFPPADAGLQTVKITINKRSNNPQAGTASVGDAEVSFTYDVPSSLPTVARWDGLRYLQGVPDHIFRLFNDVGRDRSVQFITRPVNDTTMVELLYQFPTGADQDVTLMGFVARRALPGTGPAGSPGVPGTVPPIPGVTDNSTISSLLHNVDRLVTVDNKSLAAGRTDASGIVRFQVTGRQLREISSPAPAGALGVVAPVLLANFDAALCPGDCKGGAAFRVGATELVVPATTGLADVDAFRLTDSDVMGQQAPAPLQEIALGVNSVQVDVRDLLGYGGADQRSGDLHAIVADASSDKALSSGRLSPSLDANLLTGQFPVAPIQEMHVSAYRVLALLYRGDDSFYGVAYADRGYQLSLRSPAVEVPPGEGGLYLDFTGRTTNYDLRPADPAFSIRVFYHVEAVDLGINETKEVVLKEAESRTIFFPINLTQAAQVTVSVGTTSGDVLPLRQTIVAVWEETPTDDRFGTPGFEATLVLAGLVGLLVVLRRRRA